LSDVKRLEHHAAVTLQSKDILSEDEIIAALHRSLFGEDTLPPQTSALVKQTIAYLHQNYARPLNRWEIAEEIGASGRILSSCRSCSDAGHKKSRMGRRLGSARSFQPQIIQAISDWAAMPFRGHSTMTLTFAVG
jgi:hypothetical protein